LELYIDEVLNTKKKAYNGLFCFTGEVVGQRLTILLEFIFHLLQSISALRASLRVRFLVDNCAYTCMTQANPGRVQT
jgi:hypothetical protein